MLPACHAALEPSHAFGKHQPSTMPIPGRPPRMSSSRTTAVRATGGGLAAGEGEASGAGTGYTSHSVMLVELSMVMPSPEAAQGMREALLAGMVACQGAKAGLGVRIWLFVA